MSDPIGTEAPAEQPASSGPEITQEPIPSEGGGGNPAWDTVRTKLDPISFSKIEPDLKDWDKSAETRISSVNQQLKAYSDLGTPDQLKTYAELARRIDTEPEVIHEALGKFLQANGRMPETQKELTDAVDEVEGDPTEENPELAAIRAGQEKIENFLVQQAQAQQLEAADRELATEIDTLKTAHAELDDRDVQNILQRAAFLAQTTNKIPTLEDVAVEYIEKDRNRILSIQRPGDSAPRLVPTTGGTPPVNQQQQFDAGAASREDVQALIAGLVTRDRK